MEIQAEPSVKLLEAIIKEESTEGDLVLVGFPQHEGAIRARKVKGQDLGPGC
jgi:hypothetical protein